MAVADVVGAVVAKAVEALAGLWQNVLLPALTAIWNFIKTNLLPILKEKLQPVLDFLANSVLPGLKTAFDGIVGVIKTVITWLKRLATKIANIKLPDFLNPGSPTPFELGLIGIAKALKMVNRIGLDPIGFDSEFGTINGAQFATAGIPAPGAAEDTEMLTAISALGDRVEDLTVQMIDTIAQET